jgi:hypothetical protein
MFTRQQAEPLLEEVMKTHSEADEVECKSGQGDALQHALCAISNRMGQHEWDGEVKV